MYERFFEPKNLKPEWQIIYDELLVNAQFGDVITFDQFDAALERREGNSFQFNRNGLYRANQAFGQLQKKTLIAVQGVGYRVADANEHDKIAHTHVKKSRKQIRRAVDVGNATDLERLTPEELARHDVNHKINVMREQAITHIDRRRQRLTRMIQDEGLG